MRGTPGSCLQVQLSRGERDPQVMLLGWLSRGDLPHSMRTKVSRVETGFPPSVSS